MNGFRSKTKIALAVLALAASAGVQATPVTSVSIGGTSTCGAWLPNFSAASACTSGNTTSALSGAGNVELSKLGGSGSVTTMTGTTGDGRVVVLSSLVLADWTANSFALADSYIFEAFGSVGQAPSAAQLVALRTVFLSSTAGWGRLSDPNVSYITAANGGAIHIGLDGFLDVTPVLNGLIIAVNAAGGAFPGFTPIAMLPANTGAQASEVVKVQVDGGPWQYAYGFSATPTGYQSPDGSFSGNYDLTVPEPASLALFGIGLLGLCLGRRCRA